MTGDFLIRRAQIADAAVMAELRVRMYAEIDPNLLIPTEYVRVCEAFFAREAGGTTFRSWLALDGMRGIGAVTLHVLETFPRIKAPRALDGRIRSMYVDPEYRRRGVASRLLETAIAEAKGEHIDRLTLSATAYGRSLYERTGFVAHENEMIYRP
jgi:GNAT superfamily N-acetyltransferase